MSCSILYSYTNHSAYGTTPFTKLRLLVASGFLFLLVGNAYENHILVLLGLPPGDESNFFIWSLSFKWYKLCYHKLI